MDSSPDVKTAVKLYRQLSQLWGSAGMSARKWLSNEPEVLHNVPSSIQTVPQKLILTVVNFLLLKPWESCGVQRRMYLCFR